MFKNDMNKLIAGLLLVCAASVVQAQDTLKGKSVDVVSAFKPVLREAAKINFNAAPPPVDSTKPRLQYALPNQNLLFAYQPGTLKPLALDIDSGGKWDNNSFVKAGFGSLKTPFVQLGISLGDGKTAGLNIYAKHVASEGKRDFQQFSHTDAGLNGYFKTSKNMEWNARIGFISDKTYKYGYLPVTMNFPEDSITQKFNTISGRVGFHNINRTEFGLSYAPELKIDIFSDNQQNNESNTVLNLPLSKRVGELFEVKLGLTFDLTRYKPDNKSAINNTAYYLSPSVLFKKQNINLSIGARPSWDNKSFVMFPNITAEIATNDKRFAVLGAWTGYLRKTTYQYLASQNPWLRAPAALTNTRVEERYGGFRGAAGDHFSFSAKAGVNTFRNQPLFVNDTTAADGGKTFTVLNEPKMDVLHVGGELAYTLQEKLSVTAGLKFNKYKTQLLDKAYGLLPLELNAGLRVMVIKDLWLKTDLFMWDGARYLEKDGSSSTSKGAVDLNAGLEFKITKNLNLWTQFNNIFNKEYQRWNQYPVYGFNFVGGIIFNFAQKN
jgi:hypothetical protein